MPATNSSPFFQRFLTYQKERFPFLGHGVLISAFTFSAVSYSRICRGASGFIEWKDFGIGVFATITLFFLVRIFDEFKDKKDDAKYRTYLPVPRGLISLKELRVVGLITAIIQVAVIAVWQLPMLWLYGIVLAYLLLMGVEFFVPEWLKKRQIIYITSHMVIIPLVDIYASGLDWLLDGAEAHWGLAYFFAVSYCNGIVLEFGRKIRAPEDEEEGVISYTGLYGTVGGTLSWLAMLFVTFGIAVAASLYAGYGQFAVLILGGFFVICATPGFLFLRKHTTKGAKWIEYASALWTLVMYLSLGGIPMLKSLLVA